jgi:putative membrane protein
LARGIQRLFSEEDRAAIRAATGAAEERTSGEIVPYVVERCDPYEEASWKLATLGGLTAAVFSGLIHYQGAFWGGLGVLWVTLPVVAAAIVGYLLPQWVPELRRRLISSEVIERRVAQRALEAFVEEEVFDTRDRTGVLIFLALFEHQVVVLGDSGINAQVEPGDWSGIAARLAVGIRQGRSAAALIEAIEAVGELLEEKGVAIQPDDRDELSDHLRLRHE